MTPVLYVIGAALAAGLLYALVRKFYSKSKPTAASKRDIQKRAVTRILTKETPRSPTSA